MKRRPWTPTEISILRRYYPDERAIDVARRRDARCSASSYQASRWTNC